MKMATCSLIVVLAAAVVGCNQSSTTESSATSTSTSATATPSTTTPSTTESAPPATATTENADGKEITMPNGIKYVDLKVGDGTLAESGMTIAAHYTGWLTNGTKFDSSLDRGQPYSFKLGTGQVIRGWDEGIKGMRVGGKRKLTIPPNLGYGESGMGPIPPNSTLVFEVELVDAK